MLNCSPYAAGYDLAVVFTRLPYYIQIVATVGSHNKIRLGWNE